MAKQFRICSGEACSSRMPSLDYDGHSKCVGCIGQECTLETRCSECVEWPGDKMKVFLKHKAELEKSRARKARCRQFLKEQAKQAAASLVVMEGKSAAVSGAHSLSSSFHESLDLSSELSYTMDISASTSSAAFPNPDRGQVITRGEFD